MLYSPFLFVVGKEGDDGRNSVLERVAEQNS